MKQIQIHIGALAPTIGEQFPSLPKAEAERLQKLNHSLSMLSIHGILSDSEKAKARQRLVKRIAEAVAATEEGAK